MLVLVSFSIKLLGPVRGQRLKRVLVSNAFFSLEHFAIESAGLRNFFNGCDACSRCYQMHPIQSDHDLKIERDAETAGLE